jgi:hypothetical protein
VSAAGCASRTTAPTHAATRKRPWMYAIINGRPWMYAKINASSHLALSG